MTGWCTPTEDAGPFAEQTTLYYDELDLPQRLLRENRLPEAVAACLRNLARIPSVVETTKKDYGAFDLGSLPPIEAICQIAPALGDESAIGSCADLVDAIPELAPWQSWVQKARQDLELGRVLIDYVRENPGCIQSKVGKALGYDGRRVVSILYWMARAGLVLRAKAGSSYELRLPEGAVEPLPPRSPELSDRDHLAIEAAAKIGVDEKTLRAHQLRAARFNLRDTFWRVANEGLLECGKTGDWARSAVIYRAMAQLLASEERDATHLLRSAIRSEAMALRTAGVSGSELFVTGCPCAACSVPPRSIPAVVLGELGRSSRDLPETLPIPHEGCETGLCPCRLASGGSRAPGSGSQDRRSG